MATHSSILAWRIPWTSLVGYSPRGHNELDPTEQLVLSLSMMVELLKSDQVLQSL